MTTLSADNRLVHKTPRCIAKLTILAIMQCLSPAYSTSVVTSTVVVKGTLGLDSVAHRHMLPQYRSLLSCHLGTYSYDLEVPIVIVSSTLDKVLVREKKNKHLCLDRIQQHS